MSPELILIIIFIVILVLNSIIVFIVILQILIFSVTIPDSSQSYRSLRESSLP